MTPPNTKQQRKAFSDLNSSKKNVLEFLNTQNATLISSLISFVLTCNMFLASNASRSLVFCFPWLPLSSAEKQKTNRFNSTDEHVHAHTHSHTSEQNARKHTPKNHTKPPLFRNSTEESEYNYKTNHVYTQTWTNPKEFFFREVGQGFSLSKTGKAVY